MPHERQQAEVQALKFWPLLRGNIWHATSFDGARGILKDGAIRHDIDRAEYGKSFCQALGGISLFDFTAPLEDIASQYDNWHGWFGSQGHLKGRSVVWFKLGRDALGDAVKSVADTLIEWKETGYRKIIPHVEVCHRGSIPVSAISGALVNSAVDQTLFELVGRGRVLDPS